MSICGFIENDASWNLEEIAWTAMVSVVSGALAFQLYSMIRSFMFIPTFEYLTSLNPLILCASLMLLQTSADKTIFTAGKEFKVQVRKLFLWSSYYPSLSWQSCRLQRWCGSDQDY